MGLFFLASWNISGQELPIFPYKLNSSERAKVLSKKMDGGKPALNLPYLPTNFVCRGDVIDLWNTDGRDSVFSILNAPLYTGGTFSVSPANQGLNINSSTGEISVKGESGNEVQPGVYTVNYKYGTVGMEVFFFAPENVPSTAELWKTGPAYTSDISNSFTINGKEYIYIANNSQSMYVEMPTATTGTLQTWGGDDLQISSDPVWSGGVAEVPVQMIEFYNKEIVSKFSTELKLLSRVANLSTVDYGKVEFDDIFFSSDPSDPGTGIQTSVWRGRIHYENATGLVTGENDGTPKIAQASFSDNGNLFYIRNHHTGGNPTPELYFIPTLQVLRMIGDQTIPVNPASSTDPNSDDGNLLNSRPIKIVMNDGVTPLNVELGDMVIKNPNAYSYTDFEAYISGFGLNLDKNDGGIWNDNWLNHLEPASASSKVNGAHSLNVDWEFYFTSSENTYSTEKSEWFVESKIYKAKLDLSDLSNIKLVVQEEFPLNNIQVPITGLGLDKNGCLFFVAAYTQFALVKIHGWGGSCTAPADVTSPFVVSDTVADVNAQSCATDTYNLTTTVPQYLLESSGYIHPKGEPYNPLSDDPVYLPEIKKIFDISYTDESDNPVADPTSVPIGKYRVWVKQTDNGNPNGTNNKFDLRGKCVENDWYYEVDHTIIPDIIPDNIIPSSKTVEVCYGETFDLESTTTWYDDNVYTITYFESDGTTAVTNPGSVVAGSYKIKIYDSCHDVESPFDFTVTQTPDLTLDFNYDYNPQPTCGGSGVTLIPNILSGDISLGKFAFLDASNSRVLSISPANIDENTGEITSPLQGETYKVEYLAIDNSGLGCGDFSKIVSVVIAIDVANLDPQDINQVNDVTFCGAQVNLTIPDVSSGCATINGLIITYGGLDDVVDITTTIYPFAVGVSTVKYDVTDSAGDLISFEYTVTITDDESPVISPIADIIVNSSLPNCETDATWTEPTIADNCKTGIIPVITGVDEIGNVISVTNGGTFPYGVNTITYTASDDYGNMATEIFTITVIDASPPMIDVATLPADISQCGQDVILTDVLLIASCRGGGTITNDFNSNGGNASGTYPYGLTVVTFTVTDIDGSITDTKSINVTIILDDEAPIISGMPVDIVVDSSYPACNKTASWTEPTVTDNCTVGIIPVITGVDEKGNNITVTNGGEFPFGVNTITYTATDDSGNVATETFTITVTDANPPMIDVASLPADVSQCNPEVTLSNVTLTASCDVGTITNSFNNNGADASDYYPYGQTTVVTYTVTNSNGKVTDTKTVNITIYPEIDVEIDGPSSVDNGYEFELKPILTGTAVSYNWVAISGDVTFVRGSENESTAYVKLGEDASATIQLEVTNAEGCTATDQIDIVSSGDCKIPNVITPNGDGYNDVFEVPCISTYENNHMRIYDRRGVTVFEKSDYQNNWDGTNQNGDRLNGTYYYSFKSSNKSEKTGYVVVVR